jgi:hypothetical protein
VGTLRNQLVNALQLPENLHLAPNLVQEIRYLGGQLALYLVSFTFIISKVWWASSTVRRFSR